jgi:probable rRNA maturation factor
VSTLRPSSESHTEVPSRITVEAHASLADAAASAELWRVALATLAAEGAAEDAILSIVLVDDAEIASLNQQYRGMAGPTDVLAFAAQEGDAIFPVADAPQELGDIVISVETAQRQAEALGHELAAELALLVIHGCLHLLGHDHADLVSQAQFWERQSAILTGCGYADVGAERPEMHEQADDVE